MNTAGYGDMSGEAYNPRMRGVEKQPNFANWFPLSLHTAADSSMQDQTISNNTTQPPSASTSIPSRRGRGRPRVNKARDETAIEKRRAQVREAQRTYQKRKDLAVASEKSRSDDVLEAISDLSVEVEALLQTAAACGLMGQQGDIPDRIRQLWKTYDRVITRPCMKPELRLLQVKNDRRREAYSELEAMMYNTPTSNSPSDVIDINIPPQVSSHHHDDINIANMDMGVAESTLIMPFSQVQAKYPFAAMDGNGKNIWDVCQERRVKWKISENATSPT